MSDNDANGKLQIASTKTTQFSQRTVKKAPSPRSEDLREKRRAAFLKKVKEGRDEKRFDLREEDVCFVSSLDVFVGFQLTLYR